MELFLMQQIENGESSEASTLGMQRGGAAVDVVVALTAGGQREIPQLKRDSSEQVKQGSAVVSHLL
jgi:hypothetical protein